MKRLLVVAFMMLVLWATPASAHATLTSSEPASAQTLVAPPEHLTLHFSEPVTPTKDTFRVYDQRSKQQKTPKAFHPGGDPASLSVVLPDLREGQYAVVWRVVSADSHPVHGALTFQIGTASEGNNLSQSLLASDHAAPSVRILQGATRATALFFTVVALGAMVMMLAWRRVPVFEELAQRVTFWSVILLGAATLIGVLSQGVYTNVRPIASLFDLDLIQSTLTTRYGYGAVVRLLAVALALVALRWRPLFVLVSGAGIVASLAISGHAGTGRLPVAGVVLDLFHVSAASIWFGGLIMVVIALFRTHADAETKQQAFRVFSNIALMCATVVVASGLLQATRQLHSWNALFTLAYGRLVITKTLLFLVIVLIAAGSRVAVRRWNPNAQKALRTTVGIELLFALAVIVVTTILIGTSPTGAAPTSYERSSLLEGNTVTLHVEPTRTGPETMNISVNDAMGNALDVPEVLLSLTLANEGIGPLDVPLRAIAPGRFTTTNASVPLAGTWTARVTVRTGDLYESSTSFAILIL